MTAITQSARDPVILAGSRTPEAKEVEIPDDLLQPSLGQGDSPATSIYSALTGYVASFLGGPLAGAAIALANAYRLKRLRTDWPLGALAIAATAGPLWWWFRGGAQWAGAYVGSGGEQLLLRVLGLGFFALAYGWHRQYYRNMAIFGLPAPSGWVLGIAAIVGGVAVNFGLAAVLS
jgi:hypothetical protein